MKIIAILIVIIDHIGFYLWRYFSYENYYILRTIGRIAMPVFTYLIVQGFFYTKDLKKYISRMFAFAIITQIILITIDYINNIVYPDINNYPNVKTLGILFSYAFTLIVLAVIDRRIWNSKLNKFQNIIINVFLAVFLVFAYIMLNIEYGVRIPVIAVLVYGIEKLFMKNNQLLKKQDDVSVVKKVLYLIMILAVLAFSLVFLKNSPGNKYGVLFAVILIALYNGEKGRDNKFVQYMFYAVFPIQHIVLYLISVM